MRPQTPVDENVEIVCARMRERSRVGVAKYGTTTMRTDIDLPGWLRHLQEELMDAAIYTERATLGMSTLTARLAAVTADRDALTARVAELEGALASIGFVGEGDFKEETPAAKPETTETPAFKPRRFDPGNGCYHQTELDGGVGYYSPDGRRLGKSSLTLDGLIAGEFPEIPVPDKTPAPTCGTCGGSRKVVGERRLVVPCPACAAAEGGAA